MPLPIPVPNPELPPWLYDYNQGPIYTPQAEDAVFGSMLGLPVFDVTLATSAWSFETTNAIFQPPPPPVQQAVLTAGLGGIQTGQLFTQGLQYEGQE